MKCIISNYQYLEYLVIKIKTLHAEKKDYDWYFDELVSLYMPLIKSSTRKICDKFKCRVTFQEIKFKILEIFFDSIIRYKPEYKDKNKDTANFTYVYFSNYLKRKLPWDLMRLYQPARVEYDDLCVDSRHVELDSKKSQKEVEKKFECIDSGSGRPISNNFINLCRTAQKELCNDFLADVMILHFAYGYKNTEIASFYNTTSNRVKDAIEELKKYWRKNTEIINP